MTTEYPNRPSWYTKPERIKNIDDALEDVQVHGPGMWDNELADFEGDNGTSIKDWYAVSTGDDSIIAYFHTETDALSFRLKIIDRWFNG